jgi:hypothetical protein
MDVFKQIKNELDLHTHIEETILYPALEKPEETHDLTLEAYEEHKVVKTLLAELAGATAANDEWDAKAKVLRENVEHYVDEEENELFDKADHALSDEEIEALGNRMEAEKARKQGRPAPTQTAAKNGKTGKAGKASDGEPGILSKIAEFVGLGSDTKKRTAKKKPAKKTAAKKSSKTGAKKKVGTSASKRSAAGQGSKRAASRPSGSRKATGARSRKKAAKKRVGRK